MTSITWAGHRCVQEPAAILAPQNRTQGRCDRHCTIVIYCYLYCRVDIMKYLFLVIEYILIELYDDVVLLIGMFISRAETRSYI